MKVQVKKWKVAIFGDNFAVAVAVGTEKDKVIAEKKVDNAVAVVGVAVAVVDVDE